MGSRNVGPKKKKPELKVISCGFYALPGCSTGTPKPLFRCDASVADSFALPPATHSGSDEEVLHSHTPRPV